MIVFSNENNVGKLSEKELIKRICSHFSSSMPAYPYGAGDDCAVIKKDEFCDNIFATSDAVILGRHFDESINPKLAAQKLMRRNISDIAAMGGYPTHTLTSAVFSKKLSLKWLDEFCIGLSESANEFGVKLIGGDIACVDFDYFSMHLSMFGTSDFKPLLRHNAKNGDCIYVTGVLGLSYESGHHLNFTPRVSEGRWLALQKGVGVCTDLSDGLASDIKNILPENFCAVLDSQSLPLREFNGIKATLTQALCAGEDYELLFTVSADCAYELEQNFENRFGYSLNKIGEIKMASFPEEKNAIVLKTNDSFSIFDKSGFDHCS